MGEDELEEEELENRTRSLCQRLEMVAWYMICTRWHVTGTKIIVNQARFLDRTCMPMRSLQGMDHMGTQ